MLKQHQTPEPTIYKDGSLMSRIERIQVIRELAYQANEVAESTANRTFGHVPEPSETGNGMADPASVDSLMDAIDCNLDELERAVRMTLQQVQRMAEI